MMGFGGIMVLPFRAGFAASPISIFATPDGTARGFGGFLVGRCAGTAGWVEGEDADGLGFGTSVVLPFRAGFAADPISIFATPDVANLGFGMTMVGRCAGTAGWVEGEDGATLGFGYGLVLPFRTGVALGPMLIQSAATASRSTRRHSIQRSFSNSLNMIRAASLWQRPGVHFNGLE